MQVLKHKVVSIDYTLKDDQGDVLDTSDGGDPLTYLHGERNIIPGLERALEGKNTGDAIQVSIAPEDGYGEQNDELIQVVSRENFADTPELEVGMQFRIPTDDGDQMVVTIAQIEEDTVTLDANHQLAGITLHFDVTIRDVRDATSEEIEHGHAH